MGLTCRRQTIAVSLNVVKGLIRDIVIGNALEVEDPGSPVSQRFLPRARRMPCYPGKPEYYRRHREL